MTTTQQTKTLTNLLAQALHEKPFTEPQAMTAQDEASILALARAHAVAPLLYETWSEAVPHMDMAEALRQDALRLVQHSYRLLFYTKYLVGLLEAEGLCTAVLKGAATAQYYPQPELRKSGDVDLLLFSAEDCARAADCLSRNGFTLHGAQHLHHTAMIGAEGIEVELHSLLTEPFSDDAVNRKLLRMQHDMRQTVQRQDCMGVSLPVLCGAEHGMSLLLHLLQHFLTAGFGIRLLCDWVVFWEKQPRTEAERCMQLSQELGIARFAAVVTALCVQELDMDVRAAEPFLQNADAGLLEKDYLEHFFTDIMDSEEFGTRTEGRMVALQERSIRGYARTFHHQMKLNYPRAGRYVPLYPLLWLLTLLRFLHNNRTLRNTGLRSILKSAGARAALTERLELFNGDEISREASGGKRERSS